MRCLKVSPIYLAIMTVFVVFLSINVIKCRMEKRMVIGTSDVMLKYAARAQGNFVEYGSIFAINLVVLELLGTGRNMLHILGSTFVLGRTMHAVSLLLVEHKCSTMLFRQLGMFFTFSTLITCAVLIIAKIRFSEMKD